MQEYRPPRPADLDYESAILTRLTHHGAQEGAALAAYREVADDSSAGDGVKYLVRLILEDEERHHRVFEEMANAMRSYLEEIAVEPSVPTLSPQRDQRLLEQTRHLLALEKADAKELRELSRELRGAPKSMLHPLLVDLMRHDTEKHIAILEHIAARLSGH
jgi:hypothetical protein